MTVDGRRRAIAASVATLAVVVLALVAAGGLSTDRSLLTASGDATANPAGLGADGALFDPVAARAGSVTGTIGSEAGAGPDALASSSAGDGSPVAGNGSGSDRGAIHPEPGAGAPSNHPAPPPLEPAGPSRQLDPAAKSGDDATALRFVYFVEADRDFDPEAPKLIEQQARDLQDFWYQQFGGTFRLNDPVVEVVFGAHDAAWYDANPAGQDLRWFRLTNIRAEVRAALGIDADEDPDVRLVTYPAARIDGRVGANRYDGAWMDGDDLTCIGGAVDTTPYALDYPANCLTTVAHELGHVYGLGHEGEESDCMQFGFYRYVMGTEQCRFSDPNRDAVKADPRNAAWLDAAPGDQLS